MKFLLLLTLAFFFAVTISAQVPPKIEPGVSQELARWRAARYSDVRYKLNLTLEKMSPVLKGSMEIRVGVRTLMSSTPQGGVPVPIVLDWRKIKGNEGLSTISNVSINGIEASPQAAMRTGVSSLRFEEANEHIVFRDGVRMGENVIKLDFTSPILTSGSAITRYVDKEDGSEYIYSLFVPSDASTAFPVFDQPDLKARFGLTIHVVGRDRPDWRVISNARGKSGFDSTWETMWNFEETKPISTYVFAFAAGPWEKVGEGTLLSPPTQRVGSDLSSQATIEDKSVLAPNIYVRKSQAAKFQPHAAEVFRLNREGIKYLEDYFDYKFPFPKYDIVLIPEFPFGGMEHAGATFLRETGVIFPSEPTANDYISRANLIFHEAAHQWFGDTVTMRWFDDLWLKEGFAEFMAYKTLERVMPQYNAWKAFYERNKQAAYLTDSTKGTTPIYQPIENLSAAKSAYGNIVYRKAPSFLRQAEFYLDPDKFQTAVRAFLKKHEFGNAGWEDLVSEFETADGKDLKVWADIWVKRRGVPIVRLKNERTTCVETTYLEQESSLNDETIWSMKLRAIYIENSAKEVSLAKEGLFDVKRLGINVRNICPISVESSAFFPNYHDYGYGIFLLDDKSRDYVLKNIQNEKDDFLRSMMWGALWDSVRETELNPREYVELAIRVLSPGFSRPAAGKEPPKGGTQNAPAELDETIIASVLSRVSTAMTYYIEVRKPDREVGRNDQRPDYALTDVRASAKNAPASTIDLQSRLEAMLIERMRTAPTLGQRVTYYRAFLNIVSTENGRAVLKQLLARSPLRGGLPPAQSGSSPTLNTVELEIPLRTKDRFDIVTRLLILNDPDAARLLAELEKTETSDDAKRYAYAAKAAFPTNDTKEKYWNDFVNYKDISESWIEAAFGPFNSPRHAELTLPYLTRALAELPNLKRSRKIFFVNGWLGAFIGGQKSPEALDIVNKFLADNPNLDRDLRLKVLENVDLIERAVKVRAEYEKD